MGRINVLDKHTAELIAAGEVVERPSSVIKELLENSIDAGASSITVEIKCGGKTYMRITDDGCGILREDVKKAFLRHATSKVASESDLDSISTLGFRGEALASVSAVAKVELITRAAAESVGTAYIINGGLEQSTDDTGCPVGTTIIVRDLFYNIPARQKFLKKDVSEGNSVSQVVDRIALSHPDISFCFIRDGKQVLKTSGDGKLLSAVYSVYGRDFSAGLLPVDYELNGITVTGYISSPQNARPNRNMQSFFINGRFVKSRTAGAAVDEAAKGSVMVGKFLSCVLCLNMDFSTVDVNVHPAKIEVRFVNERPVFDAVYHAVKSSLLMSDKRRQAHLSGMTTTAAHVSPALSVDSPRTEIKSDAYQKELSAAASFFAQPGRTPLSGIGVRDIGKLNNTAHTRLDILRTENEEQPVTEPPAKPAVNEPDNTHIGNIGNIDDDVKPDSTESMSLIEDDTDISFRYIGEAFSTYIVIEKNEELILIDKHALHERIIYEQLKKEAAVYSQLLLVPVTVTLPMADFDCVVENLSVFASCGFEIENFGRGTLLVRSSPQYLDASDIANTVEQMAGYLVDNKRDLNTEKTDWLFHNIACRAAVKGGNRSTDKELTELARTMLNDSSLRYCPHGRPVSITMIKSDLEKQFGRA